MRNIVNVIGWFAIVAVLVAGLVFADSLGVRKDVDYAKEGDEKPKVSNVEVSETSSRLIGLASVPAEKRSKRRTVRASCQVQLDSNRQVLVKSLVSGFVEQRLCDAGSRVKVGTPLFIMRSNDLALAKGAYLTAKAQLDLAKVVLDRDEVLIKDKIVSAQQYDTDRAAWLTARSAFVNAREQLLLDGLSEADIVEVTYENQSTWVTTVVTSPIDGEVIQLTNAHTRGDFVPAGTDLCQIADLTNVWAIGNAYEKDIAVLHTGSTALVQFVSYPGRHWTGLIQAISDVVNPATRTVDVRVVLVNKAPDDSGGSVPERFPLKSGLYGTMEIDTDVYPEGWVWIPQAALLPYFFQSGDKQIWVATEPTKFTERFVRVVSQEGTDVAVVGDLAPGERVVTEGNIFLAQHEGS
jgi:cobalt-zinc-cadmium efflux system membrane fusion protein